MATETKLPTANDAAVSALYHLLIDNLQSTNWANYTTAHQERMEYINKVLQNNGGKETVEALIKKIEEGVGKAVVNESNARAKDLEFRKKHPFKNFFSMNYNQYYEAAHAYRANILDHEAIKSELVAALRLVNVIELSGLSNKPKVG